MEVERTVSVPLARNPELLWGLTLTDLPWLMGGLFLDTALWHCRWGLPAKAFGLVTASAVAAAGAWLRLGGNSLLGWSWLVAEFWARPRLYLPILEQKKEG